MKSLLRIFANRSPRSSGHSLSAPVISAMQAPLDDSLDALVLDASELALLLDFDELDDELLDELVDELLDELEDDDELELDEELLDDPGGKRIDMILSHSAITWSLNQSAIESN